MSTSRGIALDALVRIEEGAYSHLALPQMLTRSDLAPRDRGFVTELVYGAVRMQRAVDYQLAKVCNRPLDSLEPVVRAALRLGAYQLLVGTAEHAAVGETVGAVPERARGFVNGVLRGAVRARPWSWPPPTDTEGIGVRTSHPDWIVDLLVHEFGHEDALATLALDDEAPPVTMRVNTRRATIAEVAAELAAAGASVERGALVPDALVVREAGDVGALGCVREGRASVQDQASQAVVHALDAQAGERVLDAAAAPGGKAAAIAERTDDRGLVVAADVNNGRVRVVARNAARLGLASVQPLVADGRRAPFARASFDRVLLDAPCSGLGVLRRRPDARWRVQPESVQELAALQRELFVECAALVRPGGRLVYSVCTMHPAETHAIDAFAAEVCPELVALDPPGAPWRPLGRGALLLPSDARTDGMYVLVLERAQPSSAN